MAFHGIHIKPSHRGLLRKSLGVKGDRKLTEGELEKAKNSEDPAERKRATFAENARKWKHGKKAKAAKRSTASKMYGKKEAAA